MSEETPKETQLPTDSSAAKVEAEVNQPKKTDVDESKNTDAEKKGAQEKEDDEILEPDYLKKLDEYTEYRDAQDDGLYGGLDDLVCTYPEGYMARQPLYSCLTCAAESGEDAGICYACSVNCHEGHEMEELFTKRNFCCDCGNSKFKGKCQLFEEKMPVNSRNVYNHNFKAKYCTCGEKYSPYVEDECRDEEMAQCVVCEDWYHLSHLTNSRSIRLKKPNTSEEATKVDEDKSPAADDCSEVVCQLCTKKFPFIVVYFNEIFANGKIPSVNEGECVYRKIRPEQPLPEDPGAVEFGHYSWRQSLCRCAACMSFYEDNQCAFILDSADAVSPFMEENEKKAKEQRGNPKTKDEELYNHLVKASDNNRDAALLVLREYQSMREELQQFLDKKIVKEKDKVIRKEDINEFFENFSAKRRRLNDE